MTKQIDLRELTASEVQTIRELALKLLTRIKQYNEWRAVSNGNDLSFAELADDVFALADALAATGFVETLNGADDFLPGADIGHFILLRPPLELQSYFERLGYAVRGLFLNVTGTTTVTLSNGKVVRPSEWTFHNGPIDAEPLRVAVDQLSEALANVTPPEPRIALANEARDKWLYDQCMKLVSYRTIIIRLRKQSKWDQIETVNGIKQAASRYAAAHNLTPIPIRQRGRSISRRAK